MALSVSSQRGCRSPAEWHRLTPLSPGGLTRSECSQCLALTNPAGHTAAPLPSHLSEQQYFGFVSRVSVFDWYGSTWKILALSVSQTLGWMWSSALRQAAVMLLSIGVGSFCYEHPPPQHEPAPPCGQARGWIEINLVKWEVLPLACTNPFQCHRLETACLGAILWKRPWRVSRMGRAGGLSLWGEAEGPALGRHSFREYDSSPPAPMWVSWSRWGQALHSGARQENVRQQA